MAADSPLPSDILAIDARRRSGYARVIEAASRANEVFDLRHAPTDRAEAMRLSTEIVEPLRGEDHHVIELLRMCWGERHDIAGALNRLGTLNENVGGRLIAATIRAPYGPVGGSLTRPEEGLSPDAWNLMDFGPSLEETLAEPLDDLTLRAIVHAKGYLVGLYDGSESNSSTLDVNTTYFTTSRSLLICLDATPEMTAVLRHDEVLRDMCASVVGRYSLMKGWVKDDSTVKEELQQSPNWTELQFHSRGRDQSRSGGRGL